LNWRIKLKRVEAGQQKILLSGAESEVVVGIGAVIVGGVIAEVIVVAVMDLVIGSLFT
jgi:type IV secretory pathway TrbD component